MPLFFILSGMTISIDLDVRRYISKMLYSYITFSFLSLIYISTIQILQGTIEVQSLSIEILSLVLFWGIGNLWFIPCLTLSKLLFIFLYKFKPLVPVAVSITASIIIIIYYLAGNTYRSLDTVFLKSIIGIFFIAVGYRLRSLVAVLFKDKILIWIMLSVFTFSHFFLFYISGFKLMDLNTLNIGNPILFFIEAIMGSSSIIILSIIIQNNRFLSFVGEYSLLFLAINYFNIIVALSREFFTFANANINNLAAFFCMLFFEVLVVKNIIKYFPIIVSYPKL